MNETELRALVRDAVARHLGSRSGGHAPSLPPARPAERPGSRPAGRPGNPSTDPHASHAIYLALTSGTDACIIEPAVSCTHCGYCKTHGY